jgi:hypothetical protein
MVAVTLTVVLTEPRSSSAVAAAGVDATAAG